MAWTDEDAPAISFTPAYRPVYERPHHEHYDHGYVHHDQGYAAYDQGYAAYAPPPPVVTTVSYANDGAKPSASAQRKLVKQMKKQDSDEARLDLLEQAAGRYDFTRVQQKELVGTFKTRDAQGEARQILAAE
jgi:hypothetical protein